MFLSPVAVAEVAAERVQCGVIRVVVVVVNDDHCRNRPSSSDNLASRAGQKPGIAEPGAASQPPQVGLNRTGQDNQQQRKQQEEFSFFVSGSVSSW